MSHVTTLYCTHCLFPNRFSGERPFSVSMFACVKCGKESEGSPVTQVWHDAALGAASQPMRHRDDCIANVVGGPCNADCAADQPTAARSALIALRGILTGRGHEEAALVDIVDEGLGRKPRATDHTAVCSYTGPLVPNEFGKLACPTCGVIPRAADNGSAG